MQSTQLMFSHCKHITLSSSLTDFSLHLLNQASVTLVVICRVCVPTSEALVPDRRSPCRELDVPCVRYLLPGHWQGRRRQEQTRGPSDSSHEGPRPGSRGIRPTSQPHTSPPAGHGREDPGKRLSGCHSTLLADAHTPSLLTELQVPRARVHCGALPGRLRANKDLTIVIHSNHCT